MLRVPFNRPTTVGHELDYIREAVERLHLSADGPFTAKCAAWIEDRTGAPQALLTHSGTAALELAALLLELEPGDEVVMPSFSYVSTAGAFALRGAVPVFVDVREDTLNIDETQVEGAITPRTRAIVAVHYAGVPCELDTLLGIADRRQLALVEDAAQALGSTYRGRPAGSFGLLAALSFHETKNLTSGEGGALLVNDPRHVERAIVLRDKGTNRQQFARGEVDRYSWVELGSSFGLSELNAAYLWAQLERAEDVDADRRRTWHSYHEAFEPLENEGRLRRPVVPAECHHNGHLYYILIGEPERRAPVLESLRERGVSAVFHFVPLHSSRGGRAYGRDHGDLRRTDDAADRLIRLPLWFGMTEQHIEAVVDAVRAVLGAKLT